ncbi:hypothetical protein CYMTET_16092 [Cymbomonas tetramitiformis]|uniref:Uncharacterized protein n=1 Tax=Cymbomonas tetramitiformis TaxID=36881 RepID=A0AAE0L8C7_9CHLO|nr:hypothetical protein CYMTET_16092 [Cymbomonas tetramitiformis]
MSEDFAKELLALAECDVEGFHTFAILSSLELVSDEALALSLHPICGGMVGFLYASSLVGRVSQVLLHTAAEEERRKTTLYGNVSSPHAGAVRSGGVWGFGGAGKEVPRGVHWGKAGPAWS